MFMLHSLGRVLHAKRPLVMGVINCTDDSFYAQSSSLKEDIIRRKIDDMVSLGVDIIDIGGQSTKPGTKQIDEKSEIERVAPAIEYTVRTYPDLWISVDTTRASVIRMAVESGACIANDISAGNMDERMLETVAELEVPYICMHMQGTPETMQLKPSYDDVTKAVIDFFHDKISTCKRLGIKEIILDPGFGFGKTMDHNYHLVRDLNKITSIGYPVLVGFSRKSMIYNLLNITANEALNGTSVLNTFALLNGVSILRVHDVKEALEVVKLCSKIKGT